MVIKFVKWFPSTTNAYCKHEESFGQEGKRDGRTPRTYPIGDERSQVPSHVEPCKFQMRNLDERRCDDLRTFLDGIDDLSWSRNAVTGEILYKKHVQG